MDRQEEDPYRQHRRNRRVAIIIGAVILGVGAFGVESWADRGLPSEIAILADLAGVTTVTGLSPIFADMVTPIAPRQTDGAQKHP